MRELIESRIEELEKEIVKADMPYSDYLALYEELVDLKNELVQYDC